MNNAVSEEGSGRKLRTRRCRQHLASAIKRRTLIRSWREKLKAVVQSGTVTDNRAEFQWKRMQRNCELHRNDFAGFQIAGQRTTDPIQPQLSRASPEITSISRAEDLHIHARIHRVPRIPARVPGCFFLSCYRSAHFVVNSSSAFWSLPRPSFRAVDIRVRRAIYLQV